MSLRLIILTFTPATIVGLHAVVPVFLRTRTTLGHTAMSSASLREPSLGELMQEEATASLSRIQGEADALFDKIDTDRDGAVSVEEFKRYLNGLKDAWATSFIDIFSLFDLDASGELSREELREAWVKYEDPGLRLALGLGTSEADIIFDQIDSNGDGAISEVELRHHMVMAGYPFPKATAATIFRTLDRNGDGRVSRTELREGHDSYMAIRAALGHEEELVLTSTQVVDGGEEMELRRPAPLTQAEIADFALQDALTSSRRQRLQPVNQVKRVRRSRPLR